MNKQFYSGREFPSRDGKRILVVDAPHWIGAYLTRELGLNGTEGISEITKRIGDYFLNGSNELNKLYSTNKGNLMLSEAVRNRCGICKEKAVALGVLLEYLEKPNVPEYVSGRTTKKDITYGQTGRHAFIKFGGMALDPALGTAELVDEHEEKLGFVRD